MIAIFGDVSGHFEPFAKGLATVGVDLEKGVMPAESKNNVTVIQVGDLIHKGPDSEDIVAAVDGMIEDYPGRWIQLLGNHEGHYFGCPFWGDEVDGWVPDKILSWINNGDANLATAIDTVEYGQVLVTHAGLSGALWSAMGEPTDAADAATLLNLHLRRDQVAAFAPGVMLSGVRRNRNPGVAWIEPSVELWPSWKGKRMPFAQVHGHASAYHWSKKRWSGSIPDWVAENADVNLQLRQLTVPISGNKIISIDPGYGQYAPGRPLLPLKLTEQS